MASSNNNDTNNNNNKNRAHRAEQKMRKRKSAGEWKSSGRMTTVCFILLSQIRFDTCVCVQYQNDNFFLSFDTSKNVERNIWYLFLCMSHSTPSTHCPIKTETFWQLNCSLFCVIFKSWIFYGGNKKTPPKITTTTMANLKHCFNE